MVLKTARAIVIAVSNHRKRRQRGSNDECRNDELSLTKKLLEIQPEMVTCWNKRKASFCRLCKESVALEDVIDNVAKEELNVSEQGLRRNPRVIAPGNTERWVIDCLYHRIFSCTQSSSRKGNDDDDDDDDDDEVIVVVVSSSSAYERYCPSRARDVGDAVKRGR